MALPSLGADGAEDVGLCGALVVRRGLSGSAQRPAARDLALLADCGPIAEPDLYVAGIVSGGQTSSALRVA
jgi:hypothetical protein